MFQAHQPACACRYLPSILYASNLRAYTPRYAFCGHYTSQGLRAVQQGYGGCEATPPALHMVASPGANLAGANRPCTACTCGSEWLPVTDYAL